MLIFIINLKKFKNKIIIKIYLQPLQDSKLIIEQEHLHNYNKIENIMMGIFFLKHQYKLLSYFYYLLIVSNFFYIH